MMKQEMGLGACSMGRSTDKPCPFPATVALPGKLPDGSGLCAYHAATEPLAEKVNELHLSLELLRAYLKGARKHPDAEPLVEVLERAEAEFSGRCELIEKVLEDLRAAEYALMRA